MSGSDIKLKMMCHMFAGNPPVFAWAIANMVRGLVDRAYKAH